MEQFRNIGIIGRLGSTQVLDTVRRLKKFLLERHLHVILEDTIAEILRAMACKPRRARCSAKSVTW